jgi:hypothetical protein
MIYNYTQSEDLKKRNCPNCKKVYLADPKRLKFGRQTTCSRKCSYELRGKNLSNSIECSCDNCGIKFNRPKSHLERSKHKKKFCSHKCKCHAMSKGIIPHVVIKPYSVQRKTESEKKERIKRYKKDNYHKMKKQASQRAKQRRAIDPLYRLRTNISRRIRSALTSGYKSQSTIKIIGCSIEELKKHLENKFTEGMSWQNYGEWHIDHIIPISSAKTDDEIYKLNHWTNFQPLWAVDNIKKSNKLIPKQFTQIQ